MKLRGDYIPVERRRLALNMIAARVAFSTIAKETGFSIRVIAGWAKRQHEGRLSEGLLRAETTRPQQLCLVDCCHDRATHGKFCERHAPRAPVGIPLSRLMAGRA